MNNKRKKKNQSVEKERRTSKKKIEMKTRMKNDTKQNNIKK